MKKQSHIDFIRLIADGKAQGEAYQLSVANKKLSPSVAHVQGCKLAKKYATEIKSERNRIAKMIEASKDSAATEIEANSIMNKAERMKLLSDIARGNISVEQAISTKDGIDVVEAKPSFAERRAAIAELNKMDGSYSPTKQEITISEVPHIITPGDEQTGH